MQEMVIYGVSFDMVGKQPIVLLKAVDTNKFLQIWIGHPEAAAILMKLQGASTPRPMTHDLLRNVIQDLKATVEKVVVCHLQDGTFYALIYLRTHGEVVAIDSRPSDAIALALRTHAPIFVEETVIDSAKTVDVATDKSDADRLQKYLESLDPDDLGYKM